MDTIKNLFHKLYSWVKSSPWRIAGVTLIAVLLLLSILVPIWVFIKIFAGALIIASLIGFVVTFAFKKADNKKISDIIGIASALVLAIGFVLFVYGVTLDPVSQSEMKAQSAKEQKEKNAADKKAAKADKQVSDLNKWFSNDYYTEMSDYYKKNNMEFMGSKEQMLNSVVKGFKIVDGNLIAIISTNRMNAEDYSEKDVASMIFGTVYTRYNSSGKKLDALNNTDDYYSHKGDWTTPTNYVRFEN